MVMQATAYHIWMQGVAAGCYGGDTEGWFDPWALLQVSFHNYSQTVRCIHFRPSKQVPYTEE